MHEAHPIRIDVETDFLEAESTPDDDHYVFAYTITIHNDGPLAARLLRRYWRITDAHGRVREVRGDGVVGEQPCLQPGTGFRYTSGAQLETPHGTMAGYYGLVDANGEPFEATIPEFLLTVPRVLH